MPRLSTVTTATPVAGKLLPLLDAEGYLPSALLPKGLPDSAYSLGKFVLPGEVLNANTGEAALIAALAAADASADQAGVCIYVPRFDYNMTQTIRVKGRYNYARAPFILCEPGTRFIWAAMPTGGTQSGAGVCFWLDGSHATNYAFANGGLANCEIVLAGNGATGIYAEMLLFAQLHDVRITGNYANTAIAGRTGSAASCAAADATYGTQVWSGLTGMTEDSVGRVLTTTGATTGANNGTFLITHYISATSVTVFNPSGTSDASNGALTWTEKYSGTGFRTRGDYTNSRGVFTTNSQNVDMQRCSAGQGRIGYWLESCYPLYAQACESNQNLTHDIVLSHNVQCTWTGGMMQSGHGGYCIWEVPNKAGGRICTFEGLYQEGAVTSVLKTYAPASGTADYVLKTVSNGNSTTYVDCSGTRSLTVETPALQAAPTVWAKLRNVDSAKFRGQFEEITSEPTKWDCDVRSREGLEVQSKKRSWYAHQPAQKSVNRLLIERGLAIDIWDPRVASKCTISGGNLQALTGLVNGIVAGPVNAGIYPTFQTSNANMAGKPSWTNVAGASGAGGCLKAALSAGLAPAGITPGLVYIARLATAANEATIRAIWFDVTIPETLSINFMDNYTSTNIGAMVRGTGGGVATVRAGDTLMIGGVVAPGMYDGITERTMCGSTENNDAYISAGGREGYVTASAGATVYMGGEITWAGNPTKVLEIGYVAALKRAPTTGERNAILDLLAAEWPGLARF